MNEYISWWLCIVVLGLTILPISSCVKELRIERTKQVQIMSEHCTKTGKTFKAETTESSDGMCI